MKDGLYCEHCGEQGGDPDELCPNCGAIMPADSEGQEGYEPEPEDYTITPSGPLGSRSSAGQVEGKFLGEFDSDEEALAAIRQDMEANQFWPNVWNVSDHGNFHLVTE